MQHLQIYFRHVPELWHDFPQLVPGLLVVQGIRADIYAEVPIASWYRQAEDRLRSQSEGQMPEIAAWRRVYAQMGLKPTKYRSAAEALLRRFKREKDLPRLHPLVDLCNAISIAYALPVAVFDLAKIDSFLEVRRAVGSETYLSFNGEIEHPGAGEIIFADASGHAHARRWTFRQSQLSVVGKNTGRVLIITEGMHERANKDVPSLLAGLTRDIAALWAEPEKEVILTADNPRLDM